jgi:hypothetical protein
MVNLLIDLALLLAMGFAAHLVVKIRLDTNDKLQVQKEFH